MANPKHNQYNNPFTATLKGITDLFKKQIPAGELKPTDRLDGKTVLVDGSSSGLGFAIAVDVAKRGAKVIMACRTGIPGKGQEVKKLSGNSDIHMLQVDFSDISSIQHLVSSIRQQFAPIDVLICNAGVVPKKSRQTKQGLEEMFMVNYFSKFIFVTLLLEGIKFNQPLPPTPSPAGEGEKGVGLKRIIFVASESHRNPSKFDWDSFGVYRNYSIGKSIELYGYYKLLLTTFGVELSRRFKESGMKISVFPMCPGPVNSNIGREAPKLMQPLLKLVFSIFFRSPAKAAIPVVYLAASPDQEGKAFDYLFLLSRKEVSELASDEESGKKLWELSEKLWEKFE
jgi:NAD(P)-dependent dehydrogenase (short-subunit alcohol dehydrogenase family)